MYQQNNGLLSIPTNSVNRKYDELKEDPIYCRHFLITLAEAVPGAVEKQSPNPLGWGSTANKMVANLESYERNQLIDICKQSGLVSDVTWKGIDSYYKMLEMLKSGKNFEIYFSRGEIDNLNEEHQQGRDILFNYDFLTELGVENGEIHLGRFLEFGDYTEGVVNNYPQEFDMTQVMKKLNSTWTELDEAHKRSMKILDTTQ